MKRFFVETTMLVGVMVLVFISGCRHGGDYEQEGTPSFYIHRSETLVIPAAIDLPANLPGGNTRVETFYAVGVQKYRAQLVPGGGAQQYSWALVAPRADLYDLSNRKVGTHGVGPHWKLYSGDSIRAEAYNPARIAPSSDPSNIDWLLLKPALGFNSTGVFTDVNYIQRIATYGGRAPSMPPVSATDTIDSPYTAIYRFSKKN